MILCASVLLYDYVIVISYFIRLLQRLNESLHLPSRYLLSAYHVAEQGEPEWFWALGLGSDLTELPFSQGVLTDGLLSARSQTSGDIWPFSTNGWVQIEEEPHPRLCGSVTGGAKVKSGFFLHTSADSHQHHLFGKAVGWLLGRMKPDLTFLLSL